MAAIRIEAVVADSFRARLIGLGGRPAGELVPMLFPACRSIHTFGMRVPVDVLWLDLAGEESQVLAVVRGLRPRRIATAPRGCTGVLELPPGSADRLGLVGGSRVVVRRA